ncbi:MAG TPA: aquaporin [Planctomycetota bacterium]|nr:aquaporin [Planctomycetota bacterium]
MPTWFGPAALDGLLLGLFMVAAGTFGTWLEGPGSALRELLPDAFVRRALMGLLMGATAVALIYSPLGQRSGAHFNPATTLAFLRLGRIEPRVAAGYVLAQFAGGALGLWVASWWLTPGLAAPDVHYVATLPGPWGRTAAFAAEVGMTFALMSVVLRLSQSRRWNRCTGLVAGMFVALYITFEAPVSGMSLNPARSFASALLARDYTALWLYLTAPVLGMVLAAELFVRQAGLHAVLCAKLHHDNPHACVFRCNWGAH